jgi:hypothetical protein
MTSIVWDSPSGGLSRLKPAPTLAGSSWSRRHRGGLTTTYVTAEPENCG